MPQDNFNLSKMDINGVIFTLKDDAAQSDIQSIASAIITNNTSISKRINDLNDRSFDSLIKISSNNNAEISNIDDGLYKIQYVTIETVEGESIETVNNIAILFQKGINQYLIKDGKILVRTKTNNTWGEWQSQEITYQFAQSGNTLQIGINGGTKSNIYTPTIPTSLPANGGDADTVNGHTVNTDVPADAVFTDTTYSNATVSKAGLMPASDKKKLNGIAEGATAVSEQTVFDWGFTKNTGTVTGVKVNDETKSPANGVVDLGTIITSHQDISGKVNTSTKVNGHALTEDVTVTKSDVGLENVTNDAQVKRTEMGAADGVATLDSNGKVPSSQLPSYVDDVLEYDKKSLFPAQGESGKIYVTKAANTTWRWSGTQYTQIKGDLTIGTTTGTVADGGIANTHYSNESNPHNVTKAQVGLSDVVNTGDSNTPVEGGTTKFTTGGAYTELAKKVDKVDGKGLSTNDYTDDDKNKLAGIAEGAEVNVQSDWNATSGDAFIKNKPTIPAAVKVKGNAESSYRTGNVNITPANIGLGNVGNFKAVSTEANQGLSDTEKSNARTNIGAGTSSFSGDYDDLSNKPTSLPANGGDADTVNGHTVNIDVPANAVFTDNNTTYQFEQSGNTLQMGTDGGTKSNIYTPNIPTSLPANGGDADTVNGHTVNIDVPADAVFTDTTYSNATVSKAGLMPASDKKKLNGIAEGATAVSEQTVSDWGFTKNTGTVTGVKVNDETKSPTNGVIDLGTVITSHQDISGKVNTSTKVNNHALTSDITLTKSDIGLENVGNFKAVSTEANQGLSDTEKSNARTNIGAGTSSFSGDYDDLTNKPIIPEILEVIADDSARAYWGGDWRMPTAEEFQALGAAVNGEWTTNYQNSGIAGLVCTDITDSSKTLFFPAAGGLQDGKFLAVGNTCAYWSSSIVNGSMERAYILNFGSTSAGWNISFRRCIGCSIRPILDGTNVNGHDYVEIGGLKWATMNIGASSISDYGLYFQWGDTQGYTSSQVGSGEGQKYFGWVDYKYGNGTSSQDASDMTKYNDTDDLTTLEISTPVEHLHKIAVTGDYNDLINKPTSGEGAVSSVNGQTGDVVLDLISLESTDSTAYSPDFDSEAHTVHITAQTLSTAQKTQARTNIGAADASTAVNSTVIRNIVTISQADYDNLSSKDNTTLYIIT